MEGDTVRSSSPGKVILFGEHAVVYGQPAIAVPVTEVKATAAVEPAPSGSGLTVVAFDLGRSFNLCAAPEDNPLAVAVRLTLEHVTSSAPDATLTVRSTIPMASGMGSGAAVATAVVKALAAFVAIPLPPSEVSRIVYEVEKIHHGTPSGIDNTVIAYERPVYFTTSESAEPTLLTVGAPFRLLIADSGLPSSTKELVERVRAGWHSDPARYESLFRRIGGLSRAARQCIEGGDVGRLGPLMDENHALLGELGVSSPTLDRLVRTARRASAAGAKLSGAGKGGNVVALVGQEGAATVAAALRQAGAVRTIETRVRMRFTVRESE